jgi:hypothetical protein
VEEDEVEVGLIEEVLVGLVVEVALEEDEEALLAGGLPPEAPLLL